MTLSTVQPLLIVLPVVFAQYILATFTLVRLAAARLPMRTYVLWNVLIMVVFFAGSIAFWIYDFKRRKKIAQADLAVTAPPQKEQSAEKMPSAQSAERGEREDAAAAIGEIKGGDLDTSEDGKSRTDCGGKWNF